MMQKEKFRMQAKQTIDKLVNQLDELEKKRDSVNEKTKASYDKQIADLKAKIVDLKKDYKALETETDEKWQKAKHRFSTGAEYIKTGLKKMTEF